MKYQYFVAGRWRNRDNILTLTQKVRSKGKRVYCFLEAKHSVHRVKNDPELEMKNFEARDWKNDPHVREVFDNDMNAELDAECFVLLLPAGKSAHIEAGVAYGMGKTCILIGEQKEAESLYLIFDECYPNVASFIKSLT